MAAHSPVMISSATSIESVSNPQSRHGGLALQSVSLRRRGQCLLEDLSARVALGETLAVMGRSGTGKTTLLRTIAGLDPPYSGRIDRVDHRVAMVFQEPRLLPWRTALQNVELVCSREEAVKWLDRVGLSAEKNLFPGALSGGMRQRVAIARALAHEAPLLLVDEPFANLDNMTAQLLRDDLISQLADGRRTVIWVTHNPVEAASVAERTLVMDGPPSGSWRFVHHDPDGIANDIVDALASLSLDNIGGGPPGSGFSFSDPR